MYLPQIHHNKSLMMKLTVLQIMVLIMSGVVFLLKTKREKIYCYLLESSTFCNHIDLWKKWNIFGKVWCTMAILYRYIVRDFMPKDFKRFVLIKFSKKLNLQCQIRLKQGKELHSEEGILEGLCPKIRKRKLPSPHRANHFARFVNKKYLKVV